MILNIQKKKIRAQSKIMMVDLKAIHDVGLLNYKFRFFLHPDWTGTDIEPELLLTECVSSELFVSRRLLSVKCCRISMPVLQAPEQTQVDVIRMSDWPPVSGFFIPLDWQTTSPCQRDLALVFFLFFFQVLLGGKCWGLV